MKKNSKGIILPSGSENFIDEYIKTLNERQLELNADYPQLNDNDIKQIKKIIFSFRGNLLMKHNMIKLCKYMGPENLLYGVLNLGDLKIKKKLQYYRYNGDIIAVDGSYSASDNELIYFRNKDMPHELIHMCSTPKNYALYQKTGFGYILNSEKKNAGLNEGYTELLARRIFFRGNYNTNCYSRNVYLMRLFELLYDGM